MSARRLTPPRRERCEDSLGIAAGPSHSRSSAPAFFGSASDRRSESRCIDPQTGSPHLPLRDEQRSDLNGRAVLGPRTWRSTLNDTSPVWGRCGRSPPSRLQAESELLMPRMGVHP
jgi:hypothetical protein